MARRSLAALDWARLRTDVPGLVDALAEAFDAGRGSVPDARLTIVGATEVSGYSPRRLYYAQEMGHLRAEHDGPSTFYRLHDVLAWMSGPHRPKTRPRPRKAKAAKPPRVRPHNPVAPEQRDPLLPFGDLT